MNTIEDFKNKITNKSRLLGLDLGSKRIGVAICDDRQSVATPFKTIIKENSDQFINELKFIIKENKIKGIVVVSNGCYIKDEGLIKDKLVFGRSPNLIFKPIKKKDKNKYLFYNSNQQ